MRVSTWKGDNFENPHEMLSVMLAQTCDQGIGLQCFAIMGIALENSLPEDAGIAKQERERTIA